MYIHERNNWWNFKYDTHAVVRFLGDVRIRQGMLLGHMQTLGFQFQADSVLSSLSIELVHSAEIEGEILNLSEVRSSLARRLGIETAGLVPTSKYVDGVVEMLLDATQHYDQPLTNDRLFGWHNVLFPTGKSSLYTIEVGKYRTGEMQVVSGAMGHEKVHYQAPSPDKVPAEMHQFLQWFNTTNDIDSVLKAAIAHLWFVSIHPFDDGNGRIARALTDMLLARSEQSGKRFYSMSSEIKLMQKDYYDVLELTQRGDGDITEWLVWFLNCLNQAIDAAEDSLSNVLEKNLFWDKHKDVLINERQRKLINLQFEGFFGNLTSSKWAKIAKCSPDTALNDINDLIKKKILVKASEGGRSTHYLLIKT